MATYTQTVQAFRDELAEVKRLHELHDKNVIDHEDRILNMLKRHGFTEEGDVPSVPPDAPQPPQPPVEPPPAPPATAFPWGERTENRTFTDSVAVMNRLRGSDPPTPGYLVDQWAWEIGTKWPDLIASLPQSSRGYIQAVMGRGTPPPT